MMDGSRLADDLRAAKALIDTPEKWTKRSFGGPNSPKCALGACEVAAGRLHWRDLDTADALLDALLPEQRGGWDSGNMVAWFNDLPSTTHADIMALFDRAIASAEGRSP